MSPISAAARQAMYSQETEEVLVALLTLDHPDVPGQGDFPYRLASNTEDVVSNGETYQAAVFEMQPPDEDPTRQNSITLVVPGPPGDLVEDLRALLNTPTLDIDTVLASDPDTVLRSWPEITLREVNADNLSVSFTLQYERLWEKPFPRDRYSVRNFPGLF